MKILQLKYITEKGRKVINECIELTKKEAETLDKNRPKYKLFETYEFEDGVFRVTNIDEQKLIIVKMFTKRAFKKMMRHDGCKYNKDYTIKIEEDI